MSLHAYSSNVFKLLSYMQNVKKLNDKICYFIVLRNIAYVSFSLCMKRVHLYMCLC